MGEDILNDTQMENLLDVVLLRSTSPDAVLLAYVCRSLLWRLSLAEEDLEEHATQMNGLPCVIKKRKAHA